MRSESPQHVVPPSPTPSRPARILGLAALGLTVAALSAGSAWLLRGLTNVAPSSPEPSARPASTAATAATAATADDATPRCLKVGRLVYQVHCSRCHGPEGRGDGPDAAALHPAPRDFFTRPWAHGESDDAVRAVILQGVPGTSMTGWSQLLNPTELDAVVAYVQSLGASTPSPNRRAGLNPLLQRAGFKPLETVGAAPSITFHGLDGQARTLDQERGNAALLVFWGTTCAPCIEELPALDQLAAEYDGARLTVLPICVDEPDEEAVRAVAQAKTKDLPLFLDRTGLARLRYDVQALPCAVLIDRDGQLLGRAEGARDWNAESVRTLLHTVADSAGAPTP